MQAHTCINFYLYVFVCTALMPSPTISSSPASACRLMESEQEIPIRSAPIPSIQPPGNAPKQATLPGGSLADNPGKKFVTRVTAYASAKA
jgi:hypothetical protein